jgi:hypothetical protein
MKDTASPQPGPRKSRLVQKADAISGMFQERA